MAAAAVCGLVNGVLITQLKVVPFIVTLGTMLIVRGAAKGLADERRIEAPITWLNDLLRSQSSGALLPAGIWAVIVLALVVAGILRYTRFGRHVFAIGSNERMARLCGVAISRTKILVYTMSAALVGMAGLLQFSKLSVGDPTVAVGPRARHHRGGDHRRRQPHGRTRHGRRHDHRRGDHDDHPARLLAEGARQLGPADRHRRHHRRGGRARPRSLGKVAE